MKCSILMCGASKNKKPQLTFHRFPRNESLRKKWLEAIGEDHINHQRKDWFICSQHFVDSCFNRTLDVIRLRDDSLPTIFPFQPPAIQDACEPCEESNIDTDDPLAVRDTPEPCEENIIESDNVSANEVQKEVTENNKIRTLKDKCLKQRIKIKRLSEKLRRKDKLIANLKDIIEDLGRKNQINMDEAVIIEGLSESSITTWKKRH